MNWELVAAIATLAVTIVGVGHTIFRRTKKVAEGGEGGRAIGGGGAGGNAYGQNAKGGNGGSGDVHIYNSDVSRK